MRLRRVAVELTPIEQLAAVEVPVPSAPSAVQVQRAILEARAVGFAFQRLGLEARPELAWRCQKVGDAIVGALAEWFGKESVQ